MLVITALAAFSPFAISGYIQYDEWAKFRENQVAFELAILGIHGADSVRSVRGSGHPADHRYDVRLREDATQQEIDAATVFRRPSNHEDSLINLRDDFSVCIYTADERRARHETAYCADPAPAEDAPWRTMSEFEATIGEST